MTAKLICAVIAVLCICIRISGLFIDYNHILPHAKEFCVSIDFRIISSIVYFVLFQFSKSVYSGKRFMLYNFLSNSYAFLIIAGALFTTFTQQHNPGDAMALFLLGLLGVAVLWIFELRQTIFFTLITAVIFFAGLHYFQTDPGQLIKSYVLAACILVIFFCISRICFSYHYNYFIQIKIIEQKNREINKINNMQTEILSIVAHDLRSPINNIAALVDLAKNYSTTEAERNEYYEMILGACNETDHIIHDLVDVAKTTENTTLKTTEINLNQFLAATQTQWLHRIGEGRQLVLRQPDSDLLAQINPQRMQRVLDNLINNAVKFTNEHGIIHMEMQLNDNKVCISISDDGIGIPASLQPHLFDRFSSASRRGLNGEKSYGLGLSICKQIIEQHNGSIEVKSEEGSGTTFYIELPLDDVATMQMHSLEAQLSV